MTAAKHRMRVSSKVFGTAVLALSLVGLHGSLWYFRPQLAKQISPLNHNSVVSTHGRSRKLLEFNISVDFGQRVSEMVELDHAREKVDCSEFWHLNSSEERCVFVKSTESCHADEGFFQYIQFPYCSFHGLVPLAYVLLFLWLVFLFITLGLTADDYFCNSLKVISKKLGLSENVTGVTFLAWGAAAPDIFSTLAAFSPSRNHGTQLGIQGLFGADMFITTFVVGIISFFSTVSLEPRPFTRDVLFFLGTVAWVYIILYKEEITMGESIGFIVCYVAYIIVVIVGHYIHQQWKKKMEATEKCLESHGPAASKLTDTVGDSNKSITAVADNTESNVGSEESKITPLNESATHSLSEKCFKCHGSAARKTTDTVGGSNESITAVADNVESNDFSERSINAPLDEPATHSLSAERTPLLGGKPKISGWRKFLQGLEPIDREEWSQSNLFWKLFIVYKAPVVFVLNLTIPVVDYDKEDHNWNKWLNVLHCITMPVFGVLVTKAGGLLIGGRFPVWALALCGGILLALIVAMITKSDRRPRAHCLFAYLAFVVSVIWIYSTANEIVNLLQTFGIIFGLNSAIIGVTFLGWGNSLVDFIASVVLARQGFPCMAVSACFGGTLLDMLLGIGIPCTYFTISQGHPIALPHEYHQYEISTGFLAVSLSSSAIIIPLMGFKVPRMYGVYLILLYIAYLTTTIVAEVKQI